MTAAGEVWERDGERCEVTDVTFDCVWYRTESGEFVVPVYAFNEWAAGAKRVEKESDDDSKS